MLLFKKEMFLPELVDEYLAEKYPTIPQLEMVIEEIENAIKNIKKQNFPNLFEYENLKGTPNEIPPSYEVISELKVLENDPVYKDLQDKLDYYNKIISTYETEKERLEIRASRNFTFKEVNYDKYLKMADTFFKYKQYDDFVRLMMEIFNNEYGASEIYFSVRWLGNYDILDLMYLKAPEEQKEFFKMLVDYIKQRDLIEMRDYYLKYPQLREDDNYIDYYTNEKIMKYKEELERYLNNGDD